MAGDFFCLTNAAPTAIMPAIDKAPAMGAAAGCAI